MSIALDSFASSAAGTGNLTATSTPVGTIRGVLAFVVQTGAADDQISGVTAEGVAMTRVAFNPKAAAEAGAVYCYFLGTGVNAATSALVVTVTGAATKVAHIVCLTANADCGVVDSDVTINSGSLANPSVTLSTGGLTCFAAIGGFSGFGNLSNITPTAGWTGQLEEDFGSDSGFVYAYDTVAAADVTAGWTQAADDAIAVAVAVAEVSTYNGAMSGGLQNLEGGLQ